MTAQRVGLIAMEKEGMGNNLINLVEGTEANLDEEGRGNRSRMRIIFVMSYQFSGIQHSLNALGRMLQADKHSAQIAMKRNVVKLCTDTLEHYPGHPVIVPAAARVLGGLGRTDSGVSFDSLICSPF